MPYRDFDTGFWNDPFIQRLPKDAKLLYLYLWTNEHCNQAGLYEITPKTIAFESGLTEDNIPELFSLLEGKVKWYPDANLVWVKAFIKRQARSSKFLQSAAKALTVIQHNDAVHEVIEYNAKKYRISIPYQYYMDRVGILLWSAAAAAAGTGTDEEVSLFGSFSLLRTRLQQVATGSVDRYERMKQELAQMGREKGLVPQSEWKAESGRVDMCWIDSKGKMVAAFEIDVYEPRAKSLTKLSALDCPVRCVILRTGENPHYLEQGIHVIGLGLGGIETGEAVPPSKSENGESLLEGDREGISPYQSATGLRPERAGEAALEGVSRTGSLPSKSEIEENLSEGDRAVISTWCSVKGFKMAPSDASELVARLRKEFTGVDILTESKAWAARKISEPLTAKSRVSGQIWNWMKIARKYQQERAQKGGAGGADKKHPGQAGPLTEGKRVRDVRGPLR